MLLMLAVNFLKVLFLLCFRIKQTFKGTSSFLHIYNFVEDFVRIIAYFFQLLVFICDTVMARETFSLPF